MPRRKPWDGRTPATPEAARRVLLAVAQDCVARLGAADATLSDVAAAAGVTRQTVYRYFESSDDLFHSAAALSSGGFRERMRIRARARATLPERMIECLVFTIREIPSDPHLSALVGKKEYFRLASALRLGFVQEEIVALADGVPPFSPSDLDDIAEVMLRLLHSFLFDPGEARSERDLRAFLLGVLGPLVEARARR
jgi:AcrR family transcriptional regulator